MRDYYQEMRDACAEIVKGVAEAMLKAIEKDLAQA